MNEERKAALLRELGDLNKEVNTVLAKRKAWMDANMALFAKVQIGEPIFDLDIGRKLGVVSRHYRYWDAQRNPLYDTGMDIACEYETSPMIFDNTSRQSGLRYGSAADLEADLAWKNRKRLKPADWDAVFGPSDERAASPPEP